MRPDKKEKTWLKSVNNSLVETDTGDGEFGYDSNEYEKRWDEVRKLIFDYEKTPHSAMTYDEGLKRNHNDILRNANPSHTNGYPCIGLDITGFGGGLKANFRRPILRNHSTNQDDNSNPNLDGTCNGMFCEPDGEPINPYMLYPLKCSAIPPNTAFVRDESKYYGKKDVPLAVEDVVWGLNEIRQGLYNDMSY